MAFRQMLKFTAIKWRSFLLKKIFFGILIESEQMAQMQKMAFELMWNGMR